MEPLEDTTVAPAITQDRETSNSTTDRCATGTWQRPNHTSATCNTWQQINQERKSHPSHDRKTALLGEEKIAHSEKVATEMKHDPSGWLSKQLQENDVTAIVFYRGIWCKWICHYHALVAMLIGIQTNFPAENTSFKNELLTSRIIYVFLVQQDLYAPITCKHLMSWLGNR